MYTQVQEVKQYRLTRQYCEDRIDKLVSVIENSSYADQIAFINKELSTP